MRSKITACAFAWSVICVGSTISALAADADAGTVAEKDVAFTGADNTTRLKVIEILLSDPAQRPKPEAMQGLAAELSKMIEAKPADSEALYLRGMLRCEMKDYVSSTLDLNEAIKINPQLAKAFEQRGTNYVLTNNLPLAWSDFDSAISNGLHSDLAYINRGSLAFTLGKYDLAVSDLNQAATLSHGKPTEWMALMLRSSTNGAQKNHTGVLKDTERYFVLKDKGPTAIQAEMHRRRAVALYAFTRYKEAIDQYDLALPGLNAGQKARAIFARGACYYKLGDKQKAAADKATAKQLGFTESKTAMVDRPVKGERGQLDEMLKPYIEQARQTLPEAKARYQKGLPAGQSMSVTTRIYGLDGKMEQVFVNIQSWAGDIIDGALASQVALSNHKTGEHITVAEKDVLDWTIVNADGSEEGNVIGKYLDSAKH